jgi:hemerythrin-like domain-containing protein
MTVVTQPLRDEHQDLLPQLETVRMAAEAAGQASSDVLRERLDAALAFLAHLLVHAQAEERALYPVVGRVMGAPEATATMSRDHVEVGRFVAELRRRRSRLASGPVSEDDAQELRRLLYGLYALVRVHFAKEEEVYLPILDARLSAGEARAMFEAMEREAAAALGSQSQ